jgi:hypothetical protein
VPATIWNQSVEGALIKYLKTRLLLCAIKGASDWAVAYFTFDSYALWVGVTEIVSVLGAFLGAIPAKSPRAFGAALPGEKGRPSWGCRTESRAGLSPIRRLSGSFYVPWPASSRRSGSAPTP